MAKISLSLKTPSAPKSQIWATLSDGRGINYKLYPGITINPKHWSKTYKKVLSADPQAVVHNEKLLSFTNRALKIYNDAIEEGKQPDAEYIRNKMKPVEEEKPLFFWQLWEVFLESKKGQFKPHSFVKFGSLKTHLEKFEKAQKSKLDIEKITQELLEDFQTFLYNDRNLNTQSSSKYIGIFKIFLNWCVKRRHTENIDWKYFTPIRQPDTLKVIITESELEAIRGLDLSGKNHLANVRELFVLSCLIGLRYSDYSRINKGHLKTDAEGNPILQIRQQKTEDIVELPLTPEAHSIVKRLLEGKVHSISNQKMNTYVKDLCQEAKINEPFEKITYKGRDKEIKTVKKWELISTHTGRRTFATNLLNRGVPAEVVMKFTGHRDYKSFAKYVNIPKRTEMEIVRNALLSSHLKITA